MYTNFPKSAELFNSTLTGDTLLALSGEFALTFRFWSLVFALTFSNKLYEARFTGYLLCARTFEDLFLNITVFFDIVF
jgi:hypothetical protein